MSPFNVLLNFFSLSLTLSLLVFPPPPPPPPPLLPLSLSLGVCMSLSVCLLSVSFFFWWAIFSFFFQPSTSEETWAAAVCPQGAPGSWAASSSPWTWHHQHLAVWASSFQTTVGTLSGWWCGLFRAQPCRTCWECSEARITSFWWVSN